MHYLAIHNYGQHDPWGDGSGIILAGKEKEKASYSKEKYKINVYASDKIPLNRMVPDARFSGYVLFKLNNFDKETCRSKICSRKIHHL